MKKQSGWTAVTLGVVMLLAGGCAGQPTRAERLDQINAAYNQKNYAAAYREAGQLANISRGADRDEAAYLAGLSAQQLDNNAAAERYLKVAARSTDKRLASDALASLGVIYCERGQFAQAAQSLIKAAPHLAGEDRANAYFYAAIAQQKIGQWAQARTNLILARTSTRNAIFREQIQSQLAVTGYTLQIGAFREQTNAKRSADAIASKAAQRRVGVTRLVPSRNRKGQAVILVQVGQFATFTAAQQARQKLAHTQAIIVPLSR